MLAVIGFILLAWFLIPAFITGTFNIGTITGMIISFILIIYGLWGGWINALLRLIWKSIPGKIILSIIILAIVAILGLAAATTVSMIRGNSRAAKQDATVVVLGCRVYDTHISLTLKARLDAAVEYLNENPSSACIVSGGQGDNENRTEASAMYDYLVEQGISPDRIYIEDQSKDTDENLLFSKAIIQKEGLNPVTVIATNDYHMYRALKISEKYGYDAGSLPAKTLWWLFPTNYVREMYGILEMWFLK
ncbi:MAG: YdcF family protein [Lachnospiraceae bacterium]|nr:YdcF family protein [Lachnospiraceae bacterium]